MKTIKLDIGAFVELTGRNARLYYTSGKAYDGPFDGLPAHILFELEDMGAIKPIKCAEDIKREPEYFNRNRKIIEAKRALRAI
jgi:hypothetical protein